MNNLWLKHKDINVKTCPHLQQRLKQNGSKVKQSSSAAPSLSVYSAAPPTLKVNYSSDLSTFLFHSSNFLLFFLPRSLHFILLTLKPRRNQTWQDAALLHTSAVRGCTSFYLHLLLLLLQSGHYQSLHHSVIYLFTSLLFSPDQTDSFSQRVIKSVCVCVCVAWINHNALYCCISAQL